MEPYHEIYSQAEIAKQKKMKRNETDKNEKIDLPAPSCNDAQQVDEVSQANQWQEINKLVRRRGSKNKIEFLVRWI